MRVVDIGALMLVCASAVGCPPATHARAEVFREVTFTGGRIELGVAIPPVDEQKFFTRRDDSTLVLQQQYARWADLVAISIQPGAVPRRVEFQYARGGYNPTASDYRARIGPPWTVRETGADTTTVWEDARTRFTLYQSRTAGQQRTRAVLEDLTAVQ